MFKVHASTPAREAAALAYLQGTTKLDVALRMVRRDGQVFAWTRAQQDITLPALTWGTITIPQTLYISGEGDFPRDITQSRDITQIDTWEFQAFTDPLDPLSGYVKEAEVSQGLFRDAKFALILFARDTFGAGDTRQFAWLRQRGPVGDKTLDKGVVRWKMNGLARYLQADVIEVTSSLSSKTWGDPELAFFVPNENKNTTDGFASRVQTPVSSVGSSSRRVFSSSALNQFPNDRFTDGAVEWTSGKNTGFKCQVLSFTASTGTLTLAENTPFPIQVGDGLRATIGAPQTIEQWRLYSGDGFGFPGQPELPDRNSAEQVSR